MSDQKYTDDYALHLSGLALISGIIVAIINEFIIDLPYWLANQNIWITLTIAPIGLYIFKLMVIQSINNIKKAIIWIRESSAKDKIITFTILLFGILINVFFWGGLIKKINYGMEISLFLFIPIIIVLWFVNHNQK